MNFGLEFREIPIRNARMEKQYKFQIFQNFPGKIIYKKDNSDFRQLWRDLKFHLIVLPEYSEMSTEWHAFERFFSSRIQENFQLKEEFRRSLHTRYSCLLK